MISQEMLDDLARDLESDEGLRLAAYQDSEGVWTIGYGRNLQTLTISAQTAKQWLLEDIAEAETDLDALEPRWRHLDSDRQRVLLNLAFNLGRTRLAGFKRFWLAIGDFLDGQGALYLSVAADELLDSKAARQTGDRYKRLADRMRVRDRP